jgi:hypothetical protein
MRQRDILVLGLSALALAACGGAEPGGMQIGTLAQQASANSQTGAETLLTQSQPRTFAALSANQRLEETVQLNIFVSPQGITDQDAINRGAQIGTAGLPVVVRDGSLPANRNIVGGQTLSVVGELYTASQPIAATGGVTVNYDPRSAVFTLNYTDSVSNISGNYRFQDPAHRTTDLQTLASRLETNSSFRLLESGSSSPEQTVAQSFFYEMPGVRTRYVSFAGFVRTTTPTLTSEQYNSMVAALQQGQPVVPVRTQRVTERSAVAYGFQTTVGDVPNTGTATFTGGMFAQMINGAFGQFDTIYGTNTTQVNFQTGAITTALSGTTQSGVAFVANGRANITVARSPNFAGRIDTASLGGTAIRIADVAPGGTPAGSIEGSFYGPQAAELGAAFRIVGGVPDQRLDILGAFTGARPGN